MTCIFCEIVNGNVPAKLIKETTHCIAFLDAFPLAKGHCLVVPKNHYERLQHLPAEENADLFETVRQLIQKVDNISGSTLMAVHNGKDSGQQIPHVHVHLVPRSKDDGAGPIHSLFKSTINLSDKEADQLCQTLKD